MSAFDLPGEVMAKSTRWPTYFFECCGGPTMKVTSVNDLFCVNSNARTDKTDRLVLFELPLEVLSANRPAIVS